MDAGSMSLHGTILFHLNLQYSAIEREDRGLVVSRCYRPMLRLLDELPWLRLAIEASAHTLEMIQELDPAWIEDLSAHWRSGRVEFIGCGDTQLIGPLVPAAVNRWNQSLGQESYEKLLGQRPSVALVNEMAWSQGLVDAYLDAGYRGLIMEWNNPHKNHREWSADWRYSQAWTESPTGRKVEVTWVDAVAFQKFQRAVHDDLEIDEYIDWVRGQLSTQARHIFLYASDAEVFDYRPGRYETEAVLTETNEWGRMAEVLRQLHAADVRITLPSDVSQEAELSARRTLCLRSAADPVPVKKQPKYNITRWALTGRDDVNLNTRCYARASELEQREVAGSVDPEDWRDLCRAWSSDLRTHLTDRRWSRIQSGQELPTAVAEVSDAPSVSAGERPKVNWRGRHLFIGVGAAQAQLSLRRGLAIESLSFGSGPLLGTVPHGALDDIDWAADFYSGHLVVDTPASRRVTDLARVEPEVDAAGGRVTVSSSIPTPLGVLRKSITLTADELLLNYDFSGWSERPLGSTRLAFITFEPDAFEQDIWITTACGGIPESFPIDSEFDHGSSVSPLVSARAAFGASDGRLRIDDGNRGVQLTWRPDLTAAIPLVTHRMVAGRRFLRVAFSLGEIDETTRSGGRLPSFQLSIAPTCTTKGLVAA